LRIHFEGICLVNTNFQAFKDRIMGDLLPMFCNDPSRAWGCEGFKEDWRKVTERDAADFLLALDAGLIAHQGRGLYRAPRSLASEQFFWSGSKSVSPRPVSLWVEPIITVAALSRLHFKWGWPRELIGTQSRKWEFDVTAYRSADLSNEYLACEVKKTLREQNELIELMQRFSIDPYPGDALASSKEKNAYRKLKGLHARRAAIFWAAGPDGTSEVFRVTYNNGDKVVLEPACEDALTYPDA
jgi:hypothetical protein